jgi:type I restriction enzyme R subunit
MRKGDGGAGGLFLISIAVFTHSFPGCPKSVYRLVEEVAGSRADGGGLALESRDGDAAVRQVIGGAVDADDVIDLFAAAGLEGARLDILSEDFLEPCRLEQENLALETLRKLLNDQIKLNKRSNLVQAQIFPRGAREGDAQLTGKQITTAQMIAQLLELVRWVREAKRHGQELGLSDEETAFYDALAENGSAKTASGYV